MDRMVVGGLVGLGFLFVPSLIPPSPSPLTLSFLFIYLFTTILCPFCLFGFLPCHALAYAFLLCLSSFLCLACLPLCHPCMLSFTPPIFTFSTFALLAFVLAFSHHAFPFPAHLLPFLPCPLPCPHSHLHFHACWQHAPLHMPCQPCLPPASPAPWPSLIPTGDRTGQGQVWVWDWTACCPCKLPACHPGCFYLYLPAKTACQHAQHVW